MFFSWCKNCHTIMLCNTDETALFFVIYDLWFHEFVMLKPNLNKLMVLYSILTLEFIYLTTACFKVLLFLWYFFFDLTNAKTHGKNNSWSPKIFATVVGFGVFGTLPFFKNHLKLVNSIPGYIKTVYFSHEIKLGNVDLIFK